MLKNGNAIARWQECLLGQHSASFWHVLTWMKKYLAGI